ncbi:hypothetical protein RJ640_027659 [Escallonia rubra]|uniref:Uncharacterized protein n=1 Tax=Escallonia rubra TaxID=112253 RepID=A0AA88RHB7_9ASTE|nr:hypothetical protein RJ640_027659 [Escallonia rubra]
MRLISLSSFGGTPWLVTWNAPHSPQASAASATPVACQAVGDRTRNGVALNEVNGTAVNWVVAAAHVFDEMVNAAVEPNVHTYGAFINGCAKAGQVAKAFGAYDIMRSKLCCLLLFFTFNTAI